MSDLDSGVFCDHDSCVFQFSKQTVIESYISFIENFARAEKVLDDLSTKSSFQKFVEVSSHVWSVISEGRSQKFMYIAMYRHVNLKSNHKTSFLRNYLRSFIINKFLFTE